VPAGAGKRMRGFLPLPIAPWHKGLPSTPLLGWKAKYPAFCRRWAPRENTKTKATQEAGHNAREFSLVDCGIAAELFFPIA